MAKRIVHKHTLVKCKQVRADQIEFGEIAINAHESGPFLQVRDRSGEVIRVGGVIFSDHQPPCAQKGAWWVKVNTSVDPAEYTLYIYEGSKWVPVGGGAIGGGEVEWDDILNKPDCFWPCDHTHTIDEIDDFGCYFECDTYIPSLPSI